MVRRVRLQPDQKDQREHTMSFVMKKQIPRRLFLRGAGVTLALPLLDAMTPAMAQSAVAPKPRFVGIFFPHGMAPGLWEPQAEGALPDKLPFVIESLEAVKNQTTVITGLWSKSAEPPEGTTGSDHWVAAAYLTGIKPRKTAAADATVGSPTIDQIIAQKIGGETLLPSLQLAVEDPNSSSSNCGEGYSCSYTNSISWIGLPTPSTEPLMRTAPLPMELNPQVVFERRFELAAKASSDVPVFDLPPGVPEQFDDHIKLHYDLLALAFKADITRVATLLGARDLTNRVYTFPKSPLFPDGGTSPSFHGASHHQDDATQIRRYGLINRYHVSTLAYFAQKLRSIPEGDGTLLDHSLILYGTNMGNSNQHQHYDVPHFLVGGAGGKLKGNRHLHYERKSVTTGNLLLSLLDLYGIEKDVQGDSTGRLSNL